MLRVYASWLAGASHMPWRAFAFWNATGGIAWAASMVLIGYWGGEAAKKVLEQTGKFGAVVVVIVIVGVVVVYRRQQREAVDWVRRASQPDLPTLDEA